MIKVMDTNLTKKAEAAAVLRGVSEDELIERAAAKLYGVFCGEAKRGSRTVVIAGGGNNGADGLSFARLAALGGYDVAVYIVAENVNGYCRNRIDVLKAIGLGVVFARSMSDIDYNADIIIDAILGTGCTRPLGGLLAEVADSINRSRAAVIAVDMPTGLNADSGYAPGGGVIANITVTFGSYKLGQLIGEGRNYCGKVIVCDIGLGEGETAGAAYITEAADAALPERKPVSHKGNYGNVKIIAGSGGMPGAALLAHESALAALKSGAGYATLCVPRSLAGAYQCRVKEEMLCFMPDINGKMIFDESALDAAASNADAVVIGNGMGSGGDIIKMIANLAGRDIALIIDADGLNALAKDKSAVAGHKCRLILTPHVGEFRRLIGDENSAAGITEVKALARELEAVVVMKSATTIISDGTAVLLNITGTPAMAKAGSGDVLAGMLGALSAKSNPMTAAVRAAWHFGKAGERAAARLGQHSVLASDIIAAIGE